MGTSRGSANDAPLRAPATPEPRVSEPGGVDLDGASTRSEVVSRSVGAEGRARPGESVDTLPPEAWLVALAGLDQMGPRRLGALVASGDPAEVWAGIATGRLATWATPEVRRALGRDARRVLARWREQVGRVDVEATWRAHRRAGVAVHTPSSPAWPVELRRDPEPPAVLFVQGDLPAALPGRRVGIVGTRDCTRYGYDVARRLGAELTESGVHVVSGLALGIDGAAHAGAVDVAGAPPLAVVGSGLDRPYPARNAELWRRVAGTGAVVSEYPVGAPPVAWHFPARNRLIAALVDILVVVESQEAGGSMLTVDAAILRGVEVMAVPGPVTARTSAGTNRLLSEGRGVVRDALDVLVALGLTSRPREDAPVPAPMPLTDDEAQRVLTAFDWQPATLDQIVLRTGLSLVDAALALDRLIVGGWIVQRGGWYERVASP